MNTKIISTKSTQYIIHACGLLIYLIYKQTTEHLKQKKKHMHAHFATLSLHVLYIFNIYYYFYTH